MNLNNSNVHPGGDAIAAKHLCGYTARALAPLDGRRVTRQIAARIPFGTRRSEQRCGMQLRRWEVIPDWLKSA